MVMHRDLVCCKRILSISTNLLKIDESLSICPHILSKLFMSHRLNQYFQLASILFLTIHLKLMYFFSTSHYLFDKLIIQEDLTKITDSRYQVVVSTLWEESLVYHYALIVHL